MRLRKTIAVALVVATTLAFAQAASAARRCAPAGAKVLVNAAQAQVYKRKVPVRGYQQYVKYACDRATGHVIRLEHDDVEGYSVVEGPFAFAGRYIAYAPIIWTDAGDGHDVYVEVRNLRTGKALHNVPALYVKHSENEADVSSLVLKRNGSVAWIAAAFETVPDGYPYAVVKLEGRTRTLLAKGTGISRKSLRLSRDRRTISWRDGGVLQTAPLS